MKYLFDLVLVFLFLTSCKEEKKPFSTTYSEGDNEIRTFQLNTYTDTIPLKLTDIAGDFRIVRLETTDSCLVSMFNLQVNEKYIIILSMDKLVLFDSNGKYLRTLANEGRGPDEYQYLWRLTLNSQGDKLYGIQNDPAKIYYWALPGNSYKSIPVKQNIDPTDFMVVDDSLFFITNTRSQFWQNKLYVLDSTGKTRYHFPNRFNEDTKRSHSRKILYHLNGGNYYYPHWSDSIYQISGDTLMLKYAFLSHPKEEIEIEHMTPNLIMCRSFTPERDEAREMKNPFTGEIQHVTVTHGSHYQYIINTQTHKVISYRNLKNDILSDQLGLELIPSLKVYLCDYIVYFYKPTVLLKRIPEVLEKNNIDDAIRTRLQDLLENLKEDDNPVLLIGKLKNNPDGGAVLW